MKRKILTGIVLLLLPLQIFAKGDGGLPGDLFVLWGTGGRSLAMGGAMAGLADDASAAYFNPAGLVQIERHELTFMHSMMFLGSDMTMEVLNYAAPTRTIGGFGFALLAMHSGKIDYYYEDGRQEGEFRYTSLAPMLSYGRNLFSWLSFGLSYKIFYESMLGKTAYAQGLDAGFLLFPARVISIGITGINLVRPKWTLDTEVQKAPIAGKVGISARPYYNKLAICADALISEYRSPLFSMGMEYRPFYTFAVRAGADQYKATYGVGIWKDMGGRYTLRLDYAGAMHYESSGMLGAVHNISISFEFGGFRVRGLATKPTFSPKAEGEKNVAWLVLDTETRGEIKKWEVLVKDVYGSTVRKLGAYGPPPYRIAWDGKDGNGVFVEDGDYYYEYRVIEERTGKAYEWSGRLASLETVGPKGTVVMTPMGEKPELIKEEVKEDVPTTVEEEAIIIEEEVPTEEEKTPTEEEEE